MVVSRGVVMENNVSKSIKGVERGVVNTDSRFGEGSHWFHHHSLAGRGARFLGISHQKPTWKLVAPMEIILSLFL